MALTPPSWAEELTSTYNYEWPDHTINETPVDNSILHVKSPIGIKIKISHIQELRDYIDGDGSRGIVGYLMQYNINTGYIYERLGWDSISQFHQEKARLCQIFFNYDQTEYNAFQDGDYKYTMFEDPGEVKTSYASTIAGSGWTDTIDSSTKIKNYHIYELRKAIELIERRLIDREFFIDPNGKAEWVNNVLYQYPQTFRIWTDMALYPKWYHWTPDEAISYPDDWDALNGSRTPVECRISHFTQIRNAIVDIYSIDPGPISSVTTGSNLKSEAVTKATTEDVVGANVLSEARTVTADIIGSDITSSVTSVFRPTNLTKTN